MSGENERPLNAADVISRLCRLQSEVSACLDDYSNAADCFCGGGGFWASAEYDGTFERGYRNAGLSLRFIEDAVRKKIETMKAQEPPK